MTLQETIRALVIDTIRRVHEGNGRTAPELSGDSRPFDEPEGLDSLNCLEVEVLLSRELGIPGEGLILQDGEEWQRLSVEEIVRRVSERVPNADG